ncbi:GntR family transcriptional regulator [Piscinibacter koreensis]|uniref:GntR family transcriptional regulator n=1 Tax=Piscinibacter koreensis TaxID=2742824 RepID=A0A7Y6NNR6_9BURK|nr:GntR family transcriptional regulator [Schlegelella koreensis]NUZ06598.1 GntR family transcriptional regulator [Schlegelella koreensis]
MNSAPPLVREPGTALHRQIFLVLRDGIVQGTYPAGSALPTEESLVALFGVARATVRRALADLENEGLVQRRHGRGTFVRGDPPVHGMNTPSYLDLLRQTAQTSSVRVLAVETVEPPGWVRSALGLAPDARAVRANRMRLAGETPLMVTEAWVPLDIGSRITASALRKRAMYEVLMDQGVEFGRVVQQISAEAADPRKAQLLACEVGTALIRLTRLLHDRSGRPIQHLAAHMTPQHSRIVMEIPADAIDTMSAGQIVHDVAAPRTGGATPKLKR